MTRIEGTFRAFNTIEIHQADARIANSIFENNDNGFGGQGPGTRFGRLSNAPATIFVRGAQPVIIGNTFVDNVAPPIEIDVNSMVDDLQGDPGRQTGAADRHDQYHTNRGPLLRDNRLENNGLNGLKIRGGAILTTASVWDDTDIVHVVTNEIFTSNLEHEGGLRLQSAPNESLVVKFAGYGSNFNRYLGAGLSAIGDLSTGPDRVGGTIHILGQPGFPVILTSLKDDTVGAGLKPDGTPQTDTNNDGIGSIPQPGDWRGILLDQFSNDRNVAITLELESPNAAAPGQNATTSNSQFLGDLAGDVKESSEALRLGFTVEGTLSAPGDVDVYSFTGVAGTMVWLDIDATDPSSDLVLEMLDPNGRLLARSVNSTVEADNPSSLFVSNLISANAVNPLPERIGQVRRTASGAVKEDGTTNPRDPGFRVVLPGAAGSRSTYFFRVRSAGRDITDPAGGLSDGSYMVQVRLREEQEFAGSTVSYADIRYAMNGIRVVGLPGTSPLMGEIAEDESAGNAFPGSGQTYANNDSAQGLSPVGPLFGTPFERQTGARPQYIGNILETALGGISVAGTISSTQDVDFYRLDISQEDVINSVGGMVPIVIDVDYADGFNRADTSINIFQEESSTTFFGESQYRLIYSGDGSNIAEDQARPLAGTDQHDLSRGSAGTKDPYIGPIALAPGTYLIAVSSAAYQPRAKLLNPVRTEPINSIRRIVDTQYVPGVTTAAPPVVQNFLPSQTLGPGGEIVSAPFSLGSYTAADLPTAYVDYNHPGGTFEIYVRDANGNETLIATTNAVSGLPVLSAGSNSIKLDLANQLFSYNFAGQDGLRLVFRGSNPSTALDRVIIGFAERGERIGSGGDPILLSGAFLGQQQSAVTRTFNLRTYSAAQDSPNLVFDYQVNSGNLDVFVVVGAQRIRVATTDGNNAGPTEVVLTGGSPQEAVISLNRWADLFPAGPPDPADIFVEFATRNDNPTSVQVSDVHVRLQNGARVMSAEPNPTYAPIQVPSSMTTTGAYQFEVRLAETFFQSNTFGAPILTQSWDTNDRLDDQTSIVAPSGADLTDGDRFAISDGGRELVFEFNSSGGVSLGNIAINFSPSDPSYVIARKIREVINSSAVQSQLSVRAASSGGVATGPAGTDAKVNLFGRARVRTIAAANPAGALQVIEHTGWSDRNIERAQSQVIIQNNTIRESRDYGIWSQPAERLADPRDSEADNGVFGPFSRSMIQDKPPLVGVQAVRNLPVLNNAVAGGIVPGVVVQNNLLEEGGLGGVKIDGESPIWMITPLQIPPTDNSATVNNAQNPDHFGAFLDDGDALIIDSDRMRLRFEFEDMAGAGTGAPTFGSGQVEGNGVSANAVPIYYREEGGDFYTRSTGNPLVAFATSAMETMHAVRDAILGSIFVTNGTTQHVRATVAQSLLGPVSGAPANINSGIYPEYYNRPAVYLEGVNNIVFANAAGGGNPFDIRPLDLGAAPQPHARIVNNTIIGKDGRASFNGEAATQEPNDTIADAIQTWQGTSHNPLEYTATGVIGDSVTTTAIAGAAADVDFFQFKLGLGERVIIDVDTNGSGLDSVLRIFDAQGRIQEFRNASGAVRTISDNDPAPGEAVSLDPYADFTALKPGVYYAAISSAGNTDYNPLSFANRVAGATTGSYTITISARHLQEFVITAQDASAYQSGDTFTVYGVPDIGTTGSAGRTFEFVLGGGGPSNPNNIPINIDADWRAPDVARAIAKAINEGGAGGQPAIPNTQNLPNGDKGTANPLPPVHAVPLGGLAGVIDAPFNTIVGDIATFLGEFATWDTNLVSGLGFNHLSEREVERLLSGPFWQINQGIELFPRRVDGRLFARGTIGSTRTVIVSMSNLGIGHDRLSTTSLSFTSVGDGTTEKFVVVKNAAYIDGNGAILVDPDANENNNLDQLLPETGVLASRGASPTILNNVFFNLQSPVIAEESRRFPLTGGLAPYGTDNPNLVLKPGEVVLGGSIFQYDEPATTNVRFGTGIEQTPTNVPNTSLDFNFDIADGTRLFVNAQAGNFLPAPNSPLVDSSIDVLPDRPSMTVVKDAVGIPRAPISAPNYDLAGQLRVDDPNVAPPAGQGQNVFKDRGAIERSDDVGPAAILLNPIDNDAQLIDLDPALSVVQLRSGVYSEFRLQLADGNEPTNPFFGLGINDDTVVSAPDGNRRTVGANVVVFENGRMLVEGIDYTFAYNSTRDEIILTPLAGVWKPSSVYEIAINNRDRFVLVAPAGDTVQDGDTFTIVDTNGGEVVFEYESGYRLQVPQSLNLLVPLAGGGFGGVDDGDRFTISTASQSVTFEFDRNNNVLAGNVAIPFILGAAQEDISDALVLAIQGSGLPVVASKVDAGTVFIGASAGVRINTTFSALNQPATTLALQMPPLGPRPGGVSDGQQFQINDGARTITFEYDTDGNVSTAAVAIDISTALTMRDLTVATANAIRSSGLSVMPQVLSDDLLYLGLPASGAVTNVNSLISVVGVSRTPDAGDTFTIAAGGSAQTFEFTNTGNVAPGNVAIVVDPQDDESTIAGRIVAAVASSGLGLSPVHLGRGNIILGGAVGDVVDVSGSPSLAVFGTPGVRSNTQMQINGPLVLTVPTRGAGDIVENSTFSITANGRTVRFEFDADNSGPSAPGNVVVPYSLLSTRNDIAASIVNSVNGSSLGIQATDLGNGQLILGNLPASNVNLGATLLTLHQAVASDGETFTISNGTTTVTFELEDVDRNNGVSSSNVPVRFSFTNGTRQTLGQAIKAAVEGAGLDLTVDVLADGTLAFDAKPTHRFDISGAPSLRISGVPGGAKAVHFVQDPSFTGSDMKRAILDAIQQALHTPLVAIDRGGDTLFVENAVTVDANIDSFFLRGVADVAGNNLKPNRINNETEFTILMPGVGLDYGDAPDPVQATPGRYPTKHAHDGARHVVGNAAILGSAITAELDGQPTMAADGDSDDGIVFGTNLNIAGAFNPHVFTSVEVTLSSPGYVDAWIDFNVDGDWDDPGERILAGARFDSSRLTRTFLVTVPANIPMPTTATTTYARFRSSTSGGLLPTGLAVDGEVEDYTVTLVPGTPPTAADDRYEINEDTSLVTTDPTGTVTPSFTIDDGIAANDTDPEGDPLLVELVDPPAVGTLSLNPDGTFTYTPPADFFGDITFTYRVNDGLLSSNNLGTVTISVREVNDPPTAGDDNLTVNEDQQLDIDQSVLTANDTAGPNETTQSLTVTAVDAVSQQGGTVTLAGGRIIYTPPTDYSGPDQFTYQVTDNGTTAGIPAPQSTTATVFLTVLDQNDPPMANGDSMATLEDTPASISVADLMANDSAGPANESGQQLTFVGVSAQSANGGTVVASGGIVTYTPPLNFVGTDTFTYTVRDDGTSGGQPDPQDGVGTVTVTVVGVNDAPTVASPFGTVVMEEDEPVRSIDLNAVFVDPDVATSGDVLTFTVLSNTNAALVTPVISGGQLQLQLSADQNGSALIEVQATDQAGESITDTLTLTVTPVNDAPRLAATLPDITVNEDAPAPQIVLTPQYFFDPDVSLNGDQLTFSVVSNTNPLLVTPTINDTTLTLSLTQNQSGVAVITVRATDSAGLSITDTFNLVVNPVNDPPSANADSYSVKQGQVLTTTDPRGINGSAADDGVLANDFDPEGDTLTVQLVDGPQFARSFQLNADGTFTYAHDFNSGRTTDSFTYRAFDGQAASQVTTVTITIDPPPPPLHQNPIEAMDVNADGFVSPIDALLVINYLNLSGGGPVSGLPSPPPYRDVNGDNFITPLDALIVINALNSRAGGEGESTVDPSWAGAVGGSIDVQAERWNVHLPMQAADGDDAGMAQSYRSPNRGLFADLNDLDPVSLVDTSWIDERKSAMASEDGATEYDLALTDLLGDDEWND
ncbi:MAG: hypothetical protein KatS3mg111_3523 [Pirellulaceae bacterium]|nr:MAG: hypothetical protein KatS3mg111_3523 [Pirellulaceae bacterium]